jgi:hypothetical protein
MIVKEEDEGDYSEYDEGIIGKSKGIGSTMYSNDSKLRIKKQ